MVVSRSEDLDYKTHFTNGHYEGFADTSEENGGHGQGFRPHDLLEAALACCTNIVIRAFAKNHNIPLAGVAVQVHLNRDNPEEARFEYGIELQGDLTEEERTRLLRAAKACAVHKTLSRKITFLECEFSNDTE
jgi:putative redox protein